MKFSKVSAVIAVSMFTAPAAMAAEILIDTFDVRQQVTDAPVSTGGTPLPGEASPDTISGEASILGGTRTLTVVHSTGAASGATLVSTGDPLPAFDSVNDPGLLRLSVSSGSALASVTYDGDVDGAGPIVGLGDLTMGGVLDRFMFADITGDLAGTTLTTSVETNGGSVFELTEFLAPGVEEFTKFTDLTLDNAGIVNATLADFTDVASIAFTFQTDNTFDGTISSISIVPLPLSSLLLLGGLGGVAGARSMSKRRHTA